MLEKTKNHFKRNRKIYISAGIGLTAGVAVGLLLNTKNIQIVDAIKLQYKSPTTNNITQVNLARRGHPGNVIVCNETGELFASQNRAADLLGLNRSNLSSHLKGKNPHVNGLTFRKVGEAK